MHAWRLLNALKIHYLDKKEITLITYCHAIIAFYNKMAQNKTSRVRWFAFTNNINGLGIKVHFEHIDGKNNVLVDSLSRLTFVICAGIIKDEVADLFIAEWRKETASKQEKEKGLRRSMQKYYADLLSQFGCQRHQSPDHSSRTISTRSYSGTHLITPSIWLHSPSYKERPSELNLSKSS
ncbi:hypothetical protein KFK09_024438 [Dendrobium nobile]|uniref:Uncharacterized protein n=1 Tax=Dendrobium nobile TaxID=94219 RepID=A0A8T3ACM7_DENNO|nr:hypothetical protein KFK09_024438 [Dendrobium nobile]